MVETAIALSLRFVMAVGAIYLLLNVIGANLYEVRAVKRQRQYRDHPHARRYRARPLVSVIIASYNSEKVIERCLNSVLKNSYRNLEIIVVDNVSADATKQQVAAIITANPQLTIKLFAKRINVPSSRAALEGYKRYGHGDLILTLEASQMLDKKALTNASRYFADDERLGILRPKLNVNAMFSSLGVFQKYQAVLNGRLAKVVGIFSVGYGINGPLIFRREAFFASSTTDKSIGYGQYADDAIIHTQSPESFFQLVAQNFSTTLKRSRITVSLELSWRRPLDWLRTLLVISTGLSAVLVPLLCGYFIYLAAVLQESTYLLVGCGLLSLLLLFAIWEDRQLRPYQKLNYTLGIPLTYGFYLLVSVIQASAVLASVLNPKKLPRGV